MMCGVSHQTKPHRPSSGRSLCHAQYSRPVEGPVTSFHYGALSRSLSLHQHGDTSMFKEIFLSRTAATYQAAPLAEPRERYLRHLTKIGSCRNTLRKCANAQLSLVRILDLGEGDRVCIPRIEAAAVIWAQPKGRQCSRAATAKARQRFVGSGVQ